MAQETALSTTGVAVSTKDMYGKRIYKQGKKSLQKVGKIHNFVFHPTERRLVGYLVKRPDAAMMFHRKDLFVRLGGLTVEDDNLVLLDQADATDSKACKYLNVDFDECVLWWNMPLCTQDGTPLGHAAVVTFDGLNGQVLSLEVQTSAASSAIMGKKEVPATLIKGFKKGIGQELAFSDKELREDEAGFLGAILLDDAVLAMDTEGGVMEAAGKATAKATHKVRVVRKAAQPTVDKATKTAGEAAEKGLFATGRQLGRAAGMFSSFKEEYDKARNADE